MNVVIVSHDQRVTNSKIDMCKTDAVHASPYGSITKLVAVHAILMILAWLFLSTSASFVARYLKKQLVPPRWFRVHQYAQACAVLLIDGR
jgi:hypothetical protein